MEPIFNEFMHGGLKSLENAQLMCEARIVSSDKKIVKALSVTGETYITPSEIINGEIRVSGKIIYKVLCLGEDNEKFILEHVSDIANKINVNVLIENDVLLDTVIFDNEITTYNHNEIKINTILEIKAYIFESQNEKYLADCAGDVISKKEICQFDKLILKDKELFSVSDVYYIKDLKNILTVENNVYLTKISLEEAKAVIQGSTISIITYIDNQDMLNCDQKNTPFIQEIPLNDLNSDNKICAKININNASIIKDENEEGKLNAEFDISVEYEAYATESIEYIDDVFSITNDLNIEKKDIHFGKMNDFYSTNERVDGVVVLEDNMPLADSILAINDRRVNITNIVTQEGGLVIDGVVCCTICYYNSDNNTINSMNSELPFSFPMILEEIKENDNIFLDSKVLNIVCKVRRGNEFDLKTDIQFSIFSSSKKCINMINNIVLGAAKTIIEYGVSVYIAKNGDTIWEIAKDLEMSTEDILNQNPNLKEPILGEQKIILFRQQKSQLDNNKITIE